MTDPITLIIHGWSDCSNSFVHMKKRLKEHGVGTVDTILYGDYESRADNITFNDVVDGLNEQMIDKGLIERDGSPKSELNIVVHSTGGLVIRHWIWRYYNDRIDECPIKRIVMLAPANFGSPLAHRGKSFLGRLVKGRWKIGDFLQVGRRLLDGLELASPYQWELAHRDILCDSECYYSRDKIQLTILTGMEDYSGIRGWVNKPGTDGTVVIAGTTLNTIKLKVDFSDPDTPHEWQEIKTADDFAFGVLPRIDHGSIVSEFEKDAGRVIDLTVEALTISSAGEFERYKNKCRNITDSAYSAFATQNPDKYGRFQQFIIHAIDDHGAPVTDYTIEFEIYQSEKAECGLLSGQKYFNQKEQEFSKNFQREIMGQIHTHSKDSSFRRLLVNLDRLEKLISKTKEEVGSFVLVMNLFVPELDRGIYYDLDSLQKVVVYDSGEDEKTDLPSLFYANTTTLLELEVNRKTSYVRIGKEPK